MPDPPRRHMARLHVLKLLSSYGVDPAEIEKRARELEAKFRAAASDALIRGDYRQSLELALTTLLVPVASPHRSATVRLALLALRELGDDIDALDFAADPEFTPIKAELKGQQARKTESGALAQFHQLDAEPQLLRKDFDALRALSATLAHVDHPAREVTVLRLALEERAQHAFQSLIADVTRHVQSASPDPLRKDVASDEPVGDGHGCETFDRRILEVVKLASGVSRAYAEQIVQYVASVRELLALADVEETRQALRLEARHRWDESLRVLLDRLRRADIVQGWQAVCDAMTLHPPAPIAEKLEELVLEWIAQRATPLLLGSSPESRAEARAALLELIETHRRVLPAATTIQLEALLEGVRPSPSPEPPPRPSGGGSPPRRGWYARLFHGKEEAAA